MTPVLRKMTGQPVQSATPEPHGTRPPGDDRAASASHEPFGQSAVEAARDASCSCRRLAAPLPRPGTTAAPGYLPCLHGHHRRPPSGSDRTWVLQSRPQFAAGDGVSVCSMYAGNRSELESRVTGPPRCVGGRQLSGQRGGGKISASGFQKFI